MANWSVVVGISRPRFSAKSTRRKVHKKASSGHEESELLAIHSMDAGASPGLNNAVFHDCKTAGCERITLNVSGMYFEAREGMLNRHPATLLGNPEKRKRYFDSLRGEYFFDRHRPTFEAIFNYYQYGGKLRRPPGVPDDIFLSEVQFFEIEEEIIDEYKEGEGYMKDEMVLPEGPVFRKIWMLFEYPETSTLAFVFAIMSVVATLVAIVLFCVETIPDVKKLTNDCINGMPNFLDPLFATESLCNAWFTIEVILRLITCPNKAAFFKDFKNWVDLAAILPYYVGIFEILSQQDCGVGGSSTSLSFLRVIRLIRIFKLTKHSAGLQVLMLTFRASFEGLGLFLITLMVCILLFSSAIYFLEAERPDSQIESIPDGFWWAVITMTTVGYGDKVPVGPLGKLVGSICALAGVLTLAIPVPIITENFNKFYTHKTGRGKEP